MPIKRRMYLSIRCDDCGQGYDALDGSIKEEMKVLLNNGWTGTHRKCYCPECSRKRDGEDL